MGGRSGRRGWKEVLEESPEEEAGRRVQEEEGRKGKEVRGWANIKQQDESRLSNDQAGRRGRKVEEATQSEISVSNAGRENDRCRAPPAWSDKHQNSSLNFSLTQIQSSLSCCGHSRLCCYTLWDQTMKIE